MSIVDNNAPFRILFYQRFYGKISELRGVAQLVERDVRDVEAAGSNPVTPTIKRLTGLPVSLFIFVCFSHYDMVK